MSAKVTAKAVSQIQNQLPSFIGEDFPLYQKFMEYYYEFMETLCVYYSVVTIGSTTYGSTFTIGETVTGQTSGAVGTIKANGAFTGINKVFIEPTNDGNFEVDEIIIGSTSAAYGTITSISRKPLNATKTFKDLINSDETSSGLLKAFKKELYPNIRDDASVDLKYFIKHLKEFYRSKGSEKSFQTLFRALYAQESLDFYYPKTDLLKVSDGIWNQDTILQLDYDADYLSFNGLTITGLTSGSTAFVSNVTTRKLGTIPLIELVLTNESGAFTIGETFSATLVSGDTLSAIILGMLTDIEITDGGTGYDIGDTITIVSDTTHLELEDLAITGFQGFLLQEDGLPETRTSYTGDSSSEGIVDSEDGASLVGFGGAATVTATTGDQITLMPITSGGNGYQLDDSFTFDNTDTNVEVTAEAVVSTIRDTYQVERLTTQLFEAVQTKTFNITGVTEEIPFGVAVVSGYLVANDETFADATKVGEIISIDDSEMRTYDRSRENSSLGAIVNGDFLFLFDSTGAAISGATNVVVFDQTITNPSSDVDFNAANYTTAAAGLIALSGTYSRTGTTVTNTIAAGHNVNQFFTINNAFSSDPVEDDMLTDNATFGSTSKQFTITRYESTTKTVFGHSTLGTFSNGNTVYLVNPNGIDQMLLEDGVPTTSGTYNGNVSTLGEIVQDDGTPDTSPIYSASISGEGSINTEDINIDVDGGTALNSTISGLSITHDFTSGGISGTTPDGLVFTPTTVANSSVFTITTTGYSGDANGAVTLISNANTPMKSAMTLEQQTFGTINTIAITSHGSGYESKPTATITNAYYNGRDEIDTVNGGFLGNNASISIGTLGGTVTAVTVSEYGHGYLTDPSVTAPVQSTQATLTPVITPTKTKEGVFADESGQPSSRKKVQDNNYYQDYSYVLQTTDSIDVWQEDVLKLLHPAGFKLFGEVAIVTLLNSQMFDRGANNINTLDDDGKTVYRDMEMRLLTLMLDDARIKVSTELEQEIEFRVTPTEIQLTLGVPAMRLEDSLEGTLLLEDGIPSSSVEYDLGEFSNFGRLRIEAESIESVIELLNKLLQTSGNPAEFFSLMSVKDVSNIEVEKYIYLEGVDNALLNETGDYMLAEEARTKVVTSEQHFFHEDDEIYLDEFVGDNLEDINGTLFRVTDADPEANIILEDGEFFLQEDGIVESAWLYVGTQSNTGLIKTEEGLEFTLSEAGLPEDRTNIDFDISNETITTNGKLFRQGKEISSGIDPFRGLMRNEYIGEFSDYQIHEYEFTAPADFSTTFSAGDTLVTRPRFLEIESQIILDSTDGTANAGEAILLEDSIPTTEGTYSGTASNMGKMLIELEKIDINTTATNDEIIITDSEFVTVGAKYISDEDEVTDNIVLDSTDGTSDAGDRIMTEDSIVTVNESDTTKQIIHLERPFTYKGVPYENNNGFLFHRHQIDQRVSV